MRLVSHHPENAFRLLFYTDAHIADRRPQSRKGDYRRDILRKLHEVTQIAQKNNVDLVINGGDLFHRKKPQVNSHFMVNVLGTLFRQMQIRHLSLVGNHDVEDGLVESVGKQPLGVLRSWGVTEIPDEGKVQIVGPVDVACFHANYATEGVLDAFQVDDFVRSPEVPTIQVVHSLLVPVKFGAFPGQPCLWWEDFKTGADIVLIGHPHVPQPVTAVDGVVFVSPGALGRADKSLHHHPQVALLWIGVDEVCVEYIQLESAKPYEEVFQVETTRLDEATDAFNVQQFVQGYLVGAELENRLTYEGLVQAVKAMPLDEPVKDKALVYLEGANNG
jgi:DNA repair exonuclease SbcCD nuclease subunit